MPHPRRRKRGAAAPLPGGAPSPPRAAAWQWESATAQRRPAIRETPIDLRTNREQDGFSVNQESFAMAAPVEQQPVVEEAAELEDAVRQAIEACGGDRSTRCARSSSRTACSSGSWPTSTPRVRRDSCEVDACRSARDFRTIETGGPSCHKDSTPAEKAELTRRAARSNARSIRVAGSASARRCSPAREDAAWLPKCPATGY